MMFADLELARRLEEAEALVAVACAHAQQQLHPELGAAVLEVNRGFAIFVGAESPLSHAVGLGMYGPLWADEMLRLEEFYRMRGASVSVDLCPLADASLLELLGNRGYRLTEFNSVMVRPLAGAETVQPETPVRLATETEERIWERTVARGFLEKDDLTQPELDVGRVIWHMPSSRCYLAFSTGCAVAAGAMAIHNGLATLFADSTLPASRRAGLQTALIRERLCAAVHEGCDLATASTLPGSVSQRNYERAGFQVAYTKAVLTR